MVTSGSQTTTSAGARRRPGAPGADRAAKAGHGLAGPVALFLAALVPAAAPGSAAELPFLPQVVISGAFEDNPRFVTSADLDGDGDLDVVAVFSFSDQIAWYENDGGDPPGFAAHGVSFLALGAMSVYPADVDGDGDLDLLGASADDDTVGWYRNLDGTGTFGNRITISSAADGAQSVFAADLDDDGDLDVLSASFDDDAIAWYESDGASPPSFTTHIVTQDPDGGGGMQGFADGARSVRAADLDGDGDLDVVSASALNDRIAWYESDGASPPTFVSRVITDAADGAGSVDVADVNRDGRLDVVASSVLDDQVAWYVNNHGGMRPWIQKPVTSSADGAISVQAADIDRDGDVDVIAASFFDDTVSWYENVTGDANNWTERQITTTASGATSAHVADLDGDGDFDAIAAASSDDTVGWHENLTIHRSASFPQPSVIASVVSPLSVFVADLDGDGDRDVLSASNAFTTTDGKVEWYENDGGTTPMFSAHTIYPFDAFSVVAADLDDDGDLDVVVGAESTIEWYENGGASPPAFTSHTLAAASGLARTLSVVDLDRDGDRDVLASLPGMDLLNWYENDGGSPPAFSPHQIDSLDTPLAAVAADLDSDGDLDVLSGSREDVVWYANDGGSPPSWTPRPIPKSLNIAFDSAIAVFAADLDADGDLDVLAGYNSSASAWWYENDGASLPGFTEHVVFPVTDPLSAISALFPADLDGDGDLDLLTGLQPGPLQGLVWYESDGGSPPSFAGTTLSTAPERATLAVDLDHDGDLDVLSLQAPIGSDQVTWYRNHGGQFALPTSDLSQGILFDGQRDDVLAIALAHRGRMGDSDLALTSLELLLESAPGVALTDLEAMSLIQEIGVLLDDGSGTFDPNADVEVAAVSVFNLADGVLSIPFLAGDPAAALSFGSSKTYFVSVEMTADASAQTPTSFLLTHLTESSSSVAPPQTGWRRSESDPRLGGSTPELDSVSQVSGVKAASAVDAAFDLPLAIEASPALMVGPIGTVLSETSCTAALDLVLIGDATVDFPLVCEAGRRIGAGAGFRIVGPLGAVILRAGEGVELRDGLRVEVGGALAIEIDPLLLPP